MRAPPFWWRPKPSLAARLLQPIGMVYGAVTASRMGRPGTRGPRPVVCVGNLVAGGAGKTPTALALARILADMGERPAFLSRGYGGRLAGPVAVDPAIHTAADVGDEPLLLAGAALTVVSRDRLAGADLCARLGASVVVMDDGLQNPALAKDLRLAVVDGGSGAGNGLCVPAGPLRAPVSAQLQHVDAVVLIGEGKAGEGVAQIARVAGLPVLHGRLVPDASVMAELAGRRVLAFAGIGRPEKFFATLLAAGADVAEEITFPDHHPFSRAEMDTICDRAAAQGLVAVTTEKDAARLAGPVLGVFRERFVALPVALTVAEPERLRSLLAEKLSRSPARELG